MRIRVLDDLSGPGIEAADRVLLVRRVPDHAIAIDSDRVGARLWPGQGEFLERLGLRIEVADPVAAPLAEPDGAVGIDLDALRLALGRRIKLRQHAVLDPADRTVVAERGEPLLAVRAGRVAVGRGKIKVLEALGLGIENGDRRTAASPDQAAVVHS